MNHFTIRDIENLCGIKAHTLRIWEQRHNIVVPKRKQSQHRIYDNDDLKQLLRISFLYHSGYKISKIAKLTPGEIQQTVENTTGNTNNHEIFIHELTAAALDFDKESFEKIVNCLIIRIGIDKCITDVFYPFLQRIGLLWLTNNIIPAQEHFVSNIIRKKIICATDGLAVDNNTGHHVLVFSPAGEFHEIPVLTANYFLQKNNYRTTYMGVNVSDDSVQYMMDHQSFTHLYVHAMTNLCSGGVKELVISLCKNFPGHTIILGGPAGKYLEKTPANLTIITSLQSMLEFLDMPVI